MANCDFFTSRGVYVNLRYIAILYTCFGEHDGGV